MAVEKCNKCKEPFEVSEHNLAMPGTKEKEPIICPYCGHTIQRTSNGWWNVRALNDDQKEKYKDE